LELILSVISVGLGVAGLAYAIYQGMERRRLQDYIRSQNWHLYAKANNANGATQKALRLYKQSAGQHVDPEVVEALAQADAFGQDVFKDVIRQIQFSEPRFDETSIEDWVRKGRISEKHGLLFKNIAPMKDRSIVVDADKA